VVVLLLLLLLLVEGPWGWQGLAMMWGLLLALLISAG
jgi:hypothetical protein